jgi:diadenosine tetraphosphate (Ap4A) HIT family hydrolase/uncharacterized protein (DUF697 family)
MEMQNCWKCGAAQPSSAVFCGNCGGRLSLDQSPCLLCCSPPDDLVIDQSDLTVSIPDPGSTPDGVLVLPRSHVANMDALSEDERNDVWRTVAKIHNAWDSQPEFDGSTVDIRDDSTGCDHVHVSLVPVRKEASIFESSRDWIKQQYEEAKRDFQRFGGWSGLSSGEWLWDLIQQSFKNYWERANVEYFERKYGSSDKKAIAERLIGVAAKNGAILGAVVGAAVSADEIVGLVTAGAAGVGIPANLLIAATAIGAETLLLVRIQLQLVANLGRLYGVPLDPDDPEDILVILAFAVGGSVSDTAGKFGMKVGSKLAGRAMKAVFKKQLLADLKRLAAKVGIKVLQRSLVKYTIPVASIAIGSTWNYASVRTVARIAGRHFEARGGRL